MQNSTQGGMLGLLDAFVGGAFSKASIFALGIMPYISASIFMQLMTILVPQISKMQKEGESGRKKINQWTRYLTVIVTAFQAAAYIGFLEYVQPGMQCLMLTQAFFWVSTVIILTAGTLFVMWLGEKITDKGFGNGTSINHHDRNSCTSSAIIYAGIYCKANRGGGGLLIFMIEIAVFIAVILRINCIGTGSKKSSGKLCKTNCW